MKKCSIGMCFVLFVVGVCSAATIKSPDGSIALSFALKKSGTLTDCPVYSVKYKGRQLVTDSRLGFELADGATLDSGFRMTSLESSAFNTKWTPVYGERSSIVDKGNQLSIVLHRDTAPSCEMQLTFRCYDEGVAMRYEIRKCGSSPQIEIKRENTEFNFLGDHVAWCAKTAQGKYSRQTISSMRTNVERPLTLETEGGVYAAIGEAALVAFARMKLRRSEKGNFSIVSQLSGGVRAPLPLTTPWRVIMIADSPGELLENNDIFLNLNDPCAIEDTSWIKPGKVIREVTLTTAGGKACVDFAVRRNLQYVEYDAGWYGHEYDDKADASTVTVDAKRSPGPLDLPEVIRYATERGIGIILYVNRRALEKQLDQILPLYREWGISGLKYGFVNVGSQQWTSWLHEAVRKAADHRLMVDIHDEYRPTGYSRTYPNLMTQEGIRGDEAAPPNDQTLMTLFTRMLCGAGDNTICYYDGRVARNATHAYQLAKAVCFYSPWQFLYWYDRPPKSDAGKGGIGDEPELEFFDHVPTVWDDTRVIHGNIGKYAVIARRNGASWFIGGMNSGEKRKFSIPLDFLQKGRRYIAYTYFDDPSVKTRTRVGIREAEVDSACVLEMVMGPQGGQAVRIVPVAGTTKRIFNGKNPTGLSSSAFPKYK